MQKTARHLLFILSLALAQSTIAAEAPKRYIGKTAMFYVNGDMPFLTRVDTGARTTSINAQNVDIADAAEDKNDNIGKQVSFTIINGKGEERRITSTIQGVTKVRNSQGTEYRYEVPMKLRWEDIETTLNVNLRDRKTMSYKLLLGRDWMHGRVVVDVDNNEGLQN
ncbi:Uncharacterised protein [BD1-7 clade bacterium]|uniref:Retropepsin-like aspartic endopeptidase domain-containing protein n=1 Tax=BD1-7 clade bacterium TaxID=2029982 RepID=A0A5S9Q0Q6_9GAMM|nr:Uncharacterised protein [BD1-7 clade bacterium]CAA0112264.1 Uncharacterised protein [BD1-7 clade bacterium]